VDDFDAGTSSDLSRSGLGFGATGGVQVFVSPHLALDGGVSLGMGKMGNVKVTDRFAVRSHPDGTSSPGRPPFPV
jgi:hypothetical protein